MHMQLQSRFSFTIPFQIFLTIRRHVFCFGAVLPGPAFQALVGSNTILFIVNFNHRIRHPDIDLFSDIGIRHRIQHLIYTYVIIILYGCLFPFCSFIRNSWKLYQIRQFFFPKQTQPATSLFLKAPFIISFQFQLNGPI